MHLKVILPTEVLIEQTVIKITAEAQNGSFCLLPHHIDFFTALVPGLLMFQSKEGQEGVLAVDEGILVKRGDRVWIATRNAIQGDDLPSLKQLVDHKFRVLDDQERQTRSALAKLEAQIARLFIEL